MINTMEEEFDRQAENLLQKNYHAVLTLSKVEFIKKLQPLREKAAELVSKEPVDFEKGHLPFIIVIKHPHLSAERAMSLVERDGKQGVTKLYPHTSTDFNTITNVTIPPSDVYLLIDIDRGQDSRNVHPNEALTRIHILNRSPLTIDEGIAIITHYPEFLMKNNCFSLLASRHSGDKRVPAIWINGEKQPNLGWCWDGNPHTWLGSASCSQRIGL